MPIIRYALMVFLVLWAVDAFADTHAAADCELATVAAAVAAAESGDLVTIPAGSCTWATPVAGKAGVTIQGAGKTQTTIIGPAFTFAVGLTNWRVTGINFEPASKPDTTNIAIYIGDAIHEGYNQNTGFKIDNCEFDGYKWGIFAGNGSWGQISQNSFIDGGVQAYGQDDEWASVAGIGGADFLFIEGNTFTATATQITHAILGYSGAKIVARYNNFISSDATHYIADAIDFHGYGHGANRSVRAWEVYNNYHVLTGSESRAVIPRGGSGVIYGNVYNEINNAYAYGEIYLWEFRLYNDTNYGPTGGVQAGCNTPTSAVTGLCSALEGIPCCDAVGRGVDQAVDPAYIWSNYKCTTAPCLGNLAAISATVDAASATYIVENTDFYNSAKPEYAAADCPHVADGTVCTSEVGISGYGVATAHTVTSSKTGTGTLSFEGEYVVADGSDSLTYTATDPNGWKHTWSGTCGATGSAATYQKTGVDADCTVIATFTEIKLMPW